MRKDHGIKISLQFCRFRTLSGQGCVKPPPHQRLGRPIILQKLILGGQTHLLQHGQRSTAQQGGKPAVKGSHLHLPAAGKHPLI